MADHTKKSINLTSIIWKEGDKYVSKCPELEVASCGDTLDEALENLKEAVELYLENAKELGMLDEELEVAFTKKFISTFEVTI
jgi:predicted RNase H-like HicB family nuclease